MIFIVFLMFFAAELPAHSAVTFMGNFSNILYTKEHAYGSSALLWREGQKIFGLFYYDEGLQGDTWRGLLEDVYFDPATGRLSFSAKLSIGIAIMDKRKQVPSRDFFTFEGVLHENSLAGKLTHLNKLDPTMIPRTEVITLKKTDFDKELIENVTSIESWKRFAEPILKFHGPKW